MSVQDQTNLLMSISTIPKALEYNIELNKLLLREWQTLDQKHKIMAIQKFQNELTEEQNALKTLKKQKQNEQDVEGQDEKKDEESIDEKKIGELIEENILMETRKNFEKIKNNSFQFQENWWELYLDFIQEYKIPINQKLINQIDVPTISQRLLKKVRKAKKRKNSQRQSSQDRKPKTKIISKGDR